MHLISVGVYSVCPPPTQHVHTCTLTYVTLKEISLGTNIYFWHRKPLLIICRRPKEGKKRKWSFHVISRCFWIYTNSGYNSMSTSVPQLLMQLIDSDPTNVDSIYYKLDEDLREHNANIYWFLLYALDKTRYCLRNFGFQIKSIELS